MERLDGEITVNDVLLYGASGQRLNLKFKKLNSDAITPTKSHSGDFGYDLYALEDVWIGSGDSKIISTGVAFQFPIGWGGLLRDRSSVAVNTSLKVTAGVIDNGYIGEVGVVMLNYGELSCKIESGQKIAQMILLPIPNFELVEVDEIISNDNRGDSGYGSTGK